MARERRALTALVAFLFSGGALAAEPDKAREEATRLHDQGRRLLIEKQYVEAERVLKQCVTVDPTFASCFMLSGSVKARLGRPDEGAQDYREFLRLAPSSDPRSRQVRKIVEQYDQVKSQDPSAPVVSAPPPGALYMESEKTRDLYEEGKRLLERQLPRDAEPVLLSCVKSDPTFAPCFMLLGSARTQRGNRKEGAKSYREFVKLAHPQDPQLPAVKKILKDSEAYQRE